MVKLNDVDREILMVAMLAKRLHMVLCFKEEDGSLSPIEITEEGESEILKHLN